MRRDEERRKRMAWIVDSKEAAQAAGADLKEDEVMYVITPDTVAGEFNRYISEELGENLDSPLERWGELPDEQREAHISAMWRYIDKRMPGLHEDFREVFEATRQKLERNGQAA